MPKTMLSAAVAGLACVAVVMVGSDSAAYDREPVRAAPADVADRRLFLPLAQILVPSEPIDLGQPRFHASGRGAVITSGAITAGAAGLVVADAATWQLGQGVRVGRAGEDSLVHAADGGWTLPPGAPEGVTVEHDAADKREGAAAVRCRVGPAASGAGTPAPLDLCEVDLGQPIGLRHDELRLWIKASVATRPGDLRLRVLRADRAPTFDLALPALTAGAWTEVYLELRRDTASSPSSGHQVLTLRCERSCADLTVHLDDMRGVRDFVARVETITDWPGAGAELRLDRSAIRTVAEARVYHDDTVAVLNWLREADQPGGTRLYAPPGTYLINAVDLPLVGGREPTASLPVYNNTELRCADPDRTVFKNIGQSETGPVVLLRSAAPGPENIRIEGCGFDWNGWNRQDYAGIMLLTPHALPDIGRNISVLDNRFFDSDLPGMRLCERGQDPCPTRQRHHILAQRVDGLWISGNRMSGGGRIKAGGSGLGRNLHIERNTIDFVNDNGITIVDTMAGLTEHVLITDNRIHNAVGAAIFFGADGESAGDVPGMVLRDVTVARNQIDGFFAAGISSILPESAEQVRIVDNTVLSQRDADIGPGQFVAGLVLKRGNAARRRATGIDIAANTVIAQGAHAAFNIAAMLLAGPLRDLTVSDNVLRCDACRNVDRGIWLAGGEFENMVMRGNRVVGAGQALLVGYSRDSRIQIDGCTIVGNTFLDSVAPFTGQVSFIADAGSTIEARGADNVIHNGRGYGVLCDGGATFQLTDLATNDFAGNAQGDIHGCPR